jgi:hypothetical protein
VNTQGQTEFYPWEQNILSAINLIYFLQIY